MSYCICSMEKWLEPAIKSKGGGGKLPVILGGWPHCIPDSEPCQSDTAASPVH